MSKNLSLAAYSPYQGTTDSAAAQASDVKFFTASQMHLLQVDLNSWSQRS